MFVELLGHSKVGVSFAVPHLQKSKGYVVIVTSLAANLRLPLASDYSLSKHALIRLAEFIVLGTINSPAS